MKPINDVCPHGPFRMILIGYVTDDDGSVAEAKYELPPGRVPTEAEITAALRESIHTIRSQTVLRDFRFMSRHEFMTHLMREHTGRDDLDIAVPGPNSFTLDKQLADG